jgi:hypothetical protein
VPKEAPHILEVDVAARGSWADLPEQPRRYRLGDRLRDSRAGRADARKRIPEVTSGRPAITPTAGHNSTPTSDAEPGQVKIAAVTTPPVTPHLHALRNARNLHLSLIQEAWDQDEGVPFREKLREAEIAYEGQAIAKDLATSRLDKVSDELTDEELNHRRAAERDEEKWPAALVRERRKREHSRARNEAEDLLLSAAADLSVAEVARKHARMALNGRFRAVQAAGWQVVHHYARREATYLRALARKHRNGPELVKLLELSGPDLPEWLLRTVSDEEA